MKAIDVQARLEYARTAVAVLRALKITGRTMRYGELAKAIGLISDGEAWHVSHRGQITDILNLAAATERQANSSSGADSLKTDALDFDRIVKDDGQPGAGFHKTSRIVTE